MFLNNRYYDPAIGVFTSVDPLVGKTGTPYLYANGNPTTFSDPSGLCWVNNGRQARDDGKGVCAIDLYMGNFESAVDQALDPVPTDPVDRYIWQMEHQGANGDYSGVAPAGAVKGFIGSAIGAVKGAACAANPECAAHALIAVASDPGAVIEGLVHWDKCGSGKVSECVGSFMFDTAAIFAPFAKGGSAEPAVLESAPEWVNITTKGSSVPNIRVWQSRATFEKSLLDLGYEPVPLGGETNIVIYTNDGYRWTVRDTARSTEAPTATFSFDGGPEVLKVRFYLP